MKNFPFKKYLETDTYLPIYLKLIPIKMFPYVPNANHFNNNFWAKI